MGTRVNGLISLGIQGGDHRVSSLKKKGGFKQKII